MDSTEMHARLVSAQHDLSELALSDTFRDFTNAVHGNPKAVFKTFDYTIEALVELRKLLETAMKLDAGEGHDDE